MPPPRWPSSKEPACQGRICRRHGLNPWVGKIPCRRKWQPTPVFLPGKSHRQRSLVGNSLWDHAGSDMSKRLSMHINCVMLAMPANCFMPPFLHLSNENNITCIVAHSHVTESKLALLAAQQANQSRDKVLGQRIVTTWKASRPR